MVQTTLRHSPLASSPRLCKEVRGERGERCCEEALLGSVRNVGARKEYVIDIRG
jgi:hypothetical protein